MEDSEPQKSPRKKMTLSEETGLEKVVIVEPYNALLNHSDTSYGEKGHNKFYIIQVLESTNFYLWTKWGRVGAALPFTNLKSCDSKAEAITEFKRKFRSKTRNEWGDEFHYVQGKYQVIETLPEQESLQLYLKKEKKRKELEEIASHFPIKCCDELSDLIKLIWDFEKFNKTLKELNLDPEQCPLGKLSRNQISQGYKILKKLQHVLETSNRESQVIELTNMFYTNIPQNFGMKRPPPINHTLKVREKLGLLENLSEMKLASSLSVRSFKLLETNNPVDVYYDQLKCKITPVYSETAEKLAFWLKNSKAMSHNFSIHLVQGFEIEREEENARYWPFSKLSNRRLLWHGSRITNFVGILSGGLKIAPKEAPSNGYNFGKGIYLTDLSTKAGRYCNASTESPEGILLICEAALGNSHMVLKSKNFKSPPGNNHSVFGVGKYCLSEEKEVEDNVSISFGSIQANPQGAQSDLQYNEYIIYDTAQVKIRYLLRVKFEFSD